MNYWSHCRFEISWPELLPDLRPRHFSLPVVATYLTEFSKYLDFYHKKGQNVTYAVTQNNFCFLFHIITRYLVA
jgi:hypothetical protein